LGVVRNPVQVGAVRQQELGCPTLSTVAGLPESVVDFFRGDAGHQLLYPRERVERGGVPQFVHTRAAPDEQACHSPAAVPDGVVQRRAAAIEPPGASMSAPRSMSASATSTSSLLAAQCNGVS